MLVMHFFAVKRKAQKGSPGPKAVGKAWVHNLAKRERGQIVNPWCS